jgi:hypothetical protein
LHWTGITDTTLFSAESPIEGASVFVVCFCYDTDKDESLAFTNTYVYDSLFFFSNATAILSNAKLISFKKLLLPADSSNTA